MGYIKTSLDRKQKCIPHYEEFKDQLSKRARYHFYPLMGTLLLDKTMKRPGDIEKERTRNRAQKKRHVEKFSFIVAARTA